MDKLMAGMARGSEYHGIVVSILLLATVKLGVMTAEEAKPMIQMSLLYSGYRLSGKGARKVVPNKEETK